MNSHEQFCNSTYDDQMHIAERELSAFIRAVSQLFGSEEARLSAEDWLDETVSIDGPPLSTSRNWRAVTIAASARLANRLAVAQASQIRSPRWSKEASVLRTMGSRRGGRDEAAWRGPVTCSVLGSKL
jgi:hypothetical protein